MMSVHVEWVKATRGSLVAACALAGPGVASAEVSTGVTEALVAGPEGSDVRPHKGRTGTEGYQSQKRPGRGFQLYYPKQEGYGQGGGGFRVAMGQAWRRYGDRVCRN